MATRLSYTDFDIEEIIDTIDRKLFSRITQPTSSSPSQHFHTLPLQSSEKTAVTTSYLELHIHTI